MAVNHDDLDHDRAYCMTCDNRPAAPEAKPSALVETVKRSERHGGNYDIVWAVCPNGHKLTSAPASKRLGQAFLAGDFTDEWCTPCGWEG